MAVSGTMQRYISIAILLAVTYIAYKFINSIIAARYHARRAKELGCGDVPLRPYKRIGGIDMIQRAMAADKEQRVPEMFMDVCNEMGVSTFRQRLFGTTSYLTVDPKNIQAILATQFQDYHIGEMRKNNFFPLLGNGIFTSDGKFWEHSRALLRPQFSRDQVGDLELEETHVQDMFKHLPVDNSGWTGVVDLGPIFFRLTLDSATEFLFGESVQSQIAALPDNSTDKINFHKKGGLNWESMATSFDGATHSLGTRGRLNQVYWLHNPQSFKDNCARVHQFADYYVQLALNTDLSTIKSRRSNSGSNLEEGHKKPKYIFLQELVRSTRDPIELRSQLLNILLAGRDTTAGLIGWTFWLLARHPAVFQKLRRTILADFGPYDAPNRTERITFASLKQCTYLQHTLNEVLRLFPSVPMNSRRAIHDTTLPRGGGPDGSQPIYIRAGQEVNYSVHVMHHRPDLWGTDAEQFKPERWTGRKAGWEYLPFNGGPRICLGQQFALTEAGYVVVRMLQRFDRVETVGVDPARDEVRHQYSVTTAPAKVVLRLREDRGAVVDE